LERKKSIIFGAGQIGRGFIGQICSDSGYELVFVDAAQPVVDLLNARKEYPVWLLGSSKEEKMVKGLHALGINEAESISSEMCGADIIFTAVGANNLALLGPLMAKGFRLRREKGNNRHANVVICENLLGGAAVLRESIEKEMEAADIEYLRDRVGFVETVVSRMVAPLSEEMKKKDPLLVTVEPYDILPVSRKGFRGEIPAVKGFYPVDNLYPYEELKLFVHNLAHAALAYFGYLAGYDYIWECMEDGKIYGMLEGIMSETKSAIVRKHDFDPKEVETYTSDLYGRFRNRALNDTVRRVGRDPLRKIGPNDRIAGAMKLCLRQSVFPENICFVLAASLCYNNEADSSSVALLEMVREKGVEYVVKNISGITDERLVKRVSEIYKEMKSDSGYFKRT